MKFSKQQFVIDYVSLRQKLKKKLPQLVVLLSFCALICGSLVAVESKRSLSSTLPPSEKNAVATVDEPGTVIDDADKTKPKPMMHTFWESVPGGCCGADENGHHQLLNAWRDAWHDNGWETNLVSMEDAKKHPDFEKMSSLFKNKNISEYDKRCFYRWLAMAALPDGGWMSDYDLFPLNFSGEESYSLVEENGNGRFTSYAHVAPALVYASKDEWQRLVNMIMEAIPPFDGFLSDMYVLKQMVEKNKQEVGIIYNPDIFVSRAGFENYHADGSLDCATLTKMKAVHFSHYRTTVASQLGVFPIKQGSATQNRGLGAAMFMKDFKNQCVTSASS